MMYSHKSSVLPSSRIGIKNGWLAYQFDETVQLFGRHVEAELSKEKSDFQRKVRFNELLGIQTAPKKVNIARLAAMQGVTVIHSKKKEIS